MAMGYVMRRSFAACRTWSTFSSNENSGVCTPMTTNPCSLYRAAHARTYGSVRSQLMHVYVQNSTRTTLPCRSAAVSGGEFSQAGAPPSEAKSLALGRFYGFTLEPCITHSLLPNPPAPHQSA